MQTMQTDKLELNFKYKGFINQNNIFWFYQDISKEMFLDKEFMSLFKSKLNWLRLLKVFDKWNLSVDLLAPYISYIKNWHKDYGKDPDGHNSDDLSLAIVQLSESKLLTSGFMQKYRKYLSWIKICFSQDLTEDFILKMLDYEKKDKQTYIFWYCFDYNMNMRRKDFLRLLY